MNTLEKIQWIGSRGRNEWDLIVLLKSPFEPISNVAKIVSRAISEKIGEPDIVWCPFHYFETQFLFPNNIFPIHLLLYGSLMEMRAVENDSIFQYFYSELNIKDTSVPYLNETLRQRLLDIWRLRSCLIECILSPTEMRDSLIRCAQKAIQYTSRSYCMEHMNILSEDKKLMTEQGVKVLDALIRLTLKEK